MIVGLDGQLFNSLRVDGFTLLHAAANSGDLELYEIIKSIPGANKFVNDQENDESWSPLLLAAA